MRYVLILIVKIYSITVFSQNYIGKNGFGSFQLLNDSTCVISFMSSMETITVEGAFPSFDTCSIVKKGNINYITSINPRILIFNNLDTLITRPCDAIPINLKFYYLLKGGQYQYYGETCLHYYDLNNKMFIINENANFYSTLVVVHYFGKTFRFLLERGKLSQLGILLDSATEDKLVFDNFPILIKGGRIKPLDEGKNFQCWVDNGFYFPVMRTNKLNKKHTFIGYWRRGITDLCQ